METSWPEEHLSDWNLFILAFPFKKKADECKMFQSNEMLENQYFVNILGNWPADSGHFKNSLKQVIWWFFVKSFLEVPFFDIWNVFDHSNLLFMSFEKLLPSGLKPDPDLTLPRMFTMKIEDKYTSCVSNVEK